MAYLQISPIPIVEGGTQVQSFIPYALITGGTAPTFPLQTVATGTAGQVLTYTGALSLPTWQPSPASSITITGDTGGSLTGNSFTFSGGVTGLTFNGAGTSETLIFSGINANNGIANIGTDTTDNAVNLGTNANVGRTTSIGSTVGTSGIIERVGTGNYSLDGAAASSYAIGASTVSGNITIGGTAQSGTITLGSSSANNTVIIGMGTGAAATTMIDIGGSNTHRTVISIGTGSGGVGNIIGIGGSGNNVIAIANTQTGGDVSIGSSMTTGTITIGGTDPASTLTLQAGSGGITTAGIAGFTVSNTNYVTVDTVAGTLGSVPVPGPGALVLIQTISSITNVTSVQFTTGITATYNNYLLIINSATIPSSATPLSKTLIVQISIDGGATYITTGYGGFIQGLIVIQESTGTTDAFIGSASNTLNNFTSGLGYVSSYGDAMGYDTTSSIFAPGNGIGIYLTTSTIVNAFRVLTADGTILWSAQAISLYGYVS
jgi:hypothetical protein